MSSSKSRSISTQTNKVEEIVEGNYVESYVIEFLTLLTVLSTIYDLIFGTYRAPGKANWNVKLVKCFSIVENCRSLTQHSPTNTYRFLYFLKVLFMCIVIWGHAMVMYYMFPKLETEEMETAFRPWSIELLGGVILNAFFMISGFLKAFHFDFSPKDDGSVQFFTRSLAMKYLRMVPMNGLMILMFFFLLPKLEDAPLSSLVKLSEIKYCTSNWWTNMLAIQNLVNLREMCHPHSWYIAADMQLFVIGTLLLIILKKNKKYGICLMILTFLYSVLYSFIKIYSNGSFQLFTEFFTVDPMNYRNSLPTLFAIHTMTFYRVGPYLIGHVTAFITKSLMEKGFKFSSVQSVCLLLISSVIGFGIQLYGFVFFMVERENNPIEMAVFGVLQPILFVLPFASLICIYFVSGLGIFKPFFKLTFYVPLGRLSYSVYLVGLGIQSYHIFNQRKMLPRFSRVEIYWWIMGDIFFVLALAVFFYFTCEGPVNNLINLFIKPYLVKRKNVSIPQKEKQNNERLNSHDSIRLSPEAINGSSITKITESVRGRIRQLNSAESSLMAKQTGIKSDDCSKKKSK